MVSTRLRRIARARLAGRKALYHTRRSPQYVKATVNYATDPDTNSVVPSLIIFYLLCLWNGWYNTFVVTAPTQILENALGHPYYTGFVYVTFFAPQLTLLGMCLRGSLGYLGAALQLFGNVGVAGILWTYIVALIDSKEWGQGNFSGTWVMASALGSVVFVIRDVRRLKDKDRWEVQHG